MHFRNKIKSVDCALKLFSFPQAWWSLNKPSGCTFLYSKLKQWTKVITILHTDYFYERVVASLAKCVRLVLNAPLYSSGDRGKTQDHKEPISNM